MAVKNGMYYNRRQNPFTNTNIPKKIKSDEDYTPVTAHLDYSINQGVGVVIAELPEVPDLTQSVRIWIIDGSTISADYEHDPTSDNIPNANHFMTALPDSDRPNLIKLPSNVVGKQVGFEYYGLGQVICAEDYMNFKAQSIELTGEFSSGGNANIDGNAEISGNINANGNINTSGNINATNGLVRANRMEVDGGGNPYLAIYWHDNMAEGERLCVGGNSRFAGNVTVTGWFNAKSINGNGSQGSVLTAGPAGEAPLFTDKVAKYDQTFYKNDPAGTEVEIVLNKPYFNTATPLILITLKRDPDDYVTETVCYHNRSSTWRHSFQFIANTVDGITYDTTRFRVDVTYAPYLHKLTIKSLDIAPWKIKVYAEFI